MTSTPPNDIVFKWTYDDVVEPSDAQNIALAICRLFKEHCSSMDLAHSAQQQEKFRHDLCKNKTCEVFAKAYPLLFTQITSSIFCDDSISNLKMMFEYKRRVSCGDITNIRAGLVIQSCLMRKYAYACIQPLI